MNKNSCCFSVITAALVLHSSASFAFSLVDAVNQTLHSHPQIQAIQNQKLAVEHEVKQARGGYLPSLSVDAGIGHETRRAPTTGDESVELRRRELGLQARQTVFDGFATSSEVSRQKARLESIQFEENAEMERIALRTTEVYLEVLRQAELLELTRSTLWEHQNIFDQMALRSKNGVGSKADLDQISARLALANANTLVAQTNLSDAQASFYRVVGVFPNLQSMRIPELPENLPASKEIALEEALDQNPVLKGASADVAAAEAQYKAAGSRYWPTFSLEADKRWDENIGGIEGEDEDLVIALRMNYTLFNGGADRARKKQSAYLHQASKDVRNNSRRQVVENVSLAWNALEALRLQLPFLQQHVESALATKTAYAKQFNIGRRTLLDLLNTETEVVEAKRALINAKYDSIFANARTYNAIGKLLDTLNVTQKAEFEKN